MTQKRPPKSDHRESGIVQRMRKSVRQLSVDSPHVLLACSGGKDSVALAWLLDELRRLGLLTFSLAHIHHGQHDRADVAADAVREIGRLVGVPVSVIQLDQADIDSHTGVGLEEAMRRERYLVLAAVARDEGADCIALAHHQTDQAETMLLHLIRGAGVDGLAGMREWESRRIPWWEAGSNPIEIGLWRPLIGEAESEIAELAADSGFTVIEDPTNIDPAYRRNAVRHQLLPVLEKIAEGSTAAIARSAEVIASDADLLDQLTEQSLAECRENGALSRAAVVQLPGAMQSRIIRRWVLDLIPMLELSSDRVAAIVELAARNRGGAVVEIGSGYSVTLRSGMLLID